MTNSTSKCCEKCVGWGECYDPNCDCHQDNYKEVFGKDRPTTHNQERNVLTDISEEGLAELEKSGAKITKIHNQEEKLWAMGEPWVSIEGVLYDLIGGAIDVEKAMGMIQSYVLKTAKEESFYSRIREDAVKEERRKVAEEILAEQKCSLGANRVRKWMEENLTKG